MAVTDRLVVFLPSAAADWRWLRLGAGGVVAHGEGAPTVAPGDDATITAIAPAEAVTLHWAELPDASPAQAVAAARLLVGEASASPLGDLHVAVGREADVAERPIAVVRSERMTRWLAALAGQGIDAATLIPSPLLLPRPSDGYTAGDFGGERVLRGGSSGFVDEPGLTAAITAGAPVVWLDDAALAGAVADAVAAPALDLRQGPFARRSRRLALDWALVRRLAWLLAAIAAVTLAIALVQLARWNASASALEAQADALARGALPAGAGPGDADRQLDERLAGLRGPGLGFSATTAALFAAIRGVPGTEVRTVAFDADGTLRVAITAQSEGQVNDLVARLYDAGCAVRPSTFTRSGAGVSGTLTIGRR